MTLVVARISGSRIAIVSDTMLSENGASLPISQGVIKSCALPGGICVSFSNSPELAWRDCWAFVGLYPEGADFGDAVKYFEQSSRATGNEYIIAFCKFPKIVKIVAGRRQETPAKTVWIGDKVAYEKFREYEARGIKTVQSGRAVSMVLFADEIEQSPASDLYSAMRQVILDNTTKSVGGFAYVLSNREDGFRQSVYCDMLYDWPHETPDTYNIEYKDKLNFGSSGENDGYSTSQLAPNYFNFNCVCFYVLKAKTAYLFHHSSTILADKCSVIANVQPTELPAKLVALLGFDLGWLVWIASGHSNTNMTDFRTGDENSSNGIQMGFKMEQNTFPPSNQPPRPPLPPLELTFTREIPTKASTG